MYMCVTIGDQETMDLATTHMYMLYIYMYMYISLTANLQYTPAMTHMY